MGTYPKVFYKLSGMPIVHLVIDPFESAFAPNVGFGVLMTSNLGTNVLYLRFATATILMKDSKV